MIEIIGEFHKVEKPSFWDRIDRHWSRYGNFYGWIFVFAIIFIYFYFLAEHQEEKQKRLNALPNNGWIVQSQPVTSDKYAGCSIDTIYNDKLRISQIKVFNCSGKPTSIEYVCGKSCSQNVQYIPKNN